MVSSFSSQNTGILLPCPFAGYELFCAIPKIELYLVPLLKVVNVSLFQIYIFTYFDYGIDQATRYFARKNVLNKKAMKQLDQIIEGRSLQLAKYPVKTDYNYDSFIFLLIETL